jgi:hypothetical integral membrane protein (TIGR02206 family)
MPYTVAHIAWDTGIAAVAVLAVVFFRRVRPAAWPVRIAIVALLVAFELQRFFTVHVAFPNRMPFYLCNVSTWAAVLACLTLRPLAVDFLYFNGLAATTMALIMPDQGTVWPASFFLNHGGIILAASVLVFGRAVPIRRLYPLRAFGMILIYFFAAALFDWRFGTNYSFMMHKPSGPTLVDLLGPWPWYWLSVAVLDTVLIWLLWLPVRGDRRPLFAQQDRKRLFAATAAKSAASHPGEFEGAGPGTAS